MKTINKIAIVQIGLVTGGTIAYLMYGCRIQLIVLNHLLLTMGYL